MIMCVWFLLTGLFCTCFLIGQIATSEW